MNDDAIFEQIAEAAHEANRVYCSAIGDDSQPEWKDAPDWQRESAINGVRFHFDNPNANPYDSHASWFAQKEAEGWKYGPVKDPEKKEHPCMVPYDELPLVQRLKDYLFIGVVRTHLRFYAELRQMEERKDIAYLERNLLVAALSKLFPAGVAKTAIEGWSEDWHSCVYIDLPTGQASWHFHDSQAELFAHLPPYEKPWDGHTTEEKYARLAALTNRSVMFGIDFVRGAHDA